jgi:amino acid transporter
MSKETYTVDDYNGHSHATYVDPVSGVESKAGVLSEAGEIYGNLQTAEEYGYVTRGQVALLNSQTRSPF